MERLTWRSATVHAVHPENPDARSLTLDVPGWPGHQPGQHVDLRLTAQDGYQAVRSYSITTPAAGTRLGVTVERVETGEVSPYLVDEARPGDWLEVRGPIGGYFVWDVEQGGPLMLIAGGSGVAPLMSMLRHRAARGSQIPTRLLYSLRSPLERLYAPELEDLAGREDGFELLLTYTRVAPRGWSGRKGRVNHEILALDAFPPEQHPLTFVCGPTHFVEAVATHLVALGHDPARVKTERFGPSGGTA